VDTAHSQHLSRLSRLLLAAVGVTFAWVLLSLALAGSQAYADETEGGSPLGAVGAVVGGTTDVVAGTAGAATDVVGDTAAAAIHIVAPVLAPVVEQVADAAPIVAPVIEVVGAGAWAVTELTGRGVVAPIVDPTLDLVGGVPVVGSLVSALGLDSAVSTGAATVDGILHQAATGLIGSVSEVITPNDSTGDPGATGTVPTSPADPRGGAGEAPAPASLVATAASVTPFEALTRAAFITGVASWLSFTSEPFASASASAGTFVDGEAAGIFDLLYSVLQVDSVLIGPGGAGPGAWVLVALGLVVAHRAWVRRAGLENDAAPPAPVLSTDVSPD